MDKSAKVLNLTFSDYTPVSAQEKLDRAGWVNFGANNLFPQYLRELAETSPVHGSLCISIADMIAGKGVDGGNNQERVDALKVAESYYGCSHDWKKFGGYYLEVIFSTDRKSIAKINHLPFEECRIGVEAESEDIVGVFHSEDWTAIKKKRNKPVFIPRFNAAKVVEQPRQVYWCFNYTSGQVYPRPDYWSAVNYIELSKQIGIYHVNNIMNGLFPSFIVSFFQGAQDPDTQRKIANDWENKLSGARNAGKFIMTFNEAEHAKPDITAFPISDADKQYEFLSNTSRQEIMVAHRITTPLLFGIREQTGFGSNKDEMISGLRIFMNQVIEPAQRKLTSGFEEILSFEIPAIELEVIPNTPISLEDVAAEIAPTQDAPTETTTAVVEENVAATALNGAQITSLVEILVQTATGVIPKDSARGVVAAAFPTLTPQQIDDIFNAIVVGSVNPNEVAMNALKLTMAAIEKKKDVASDATADWLIERGSNAPDNYILVDAFEVDYETDDQHNAEIDSIVLHEFATRIVPPTSPNQISEQDERIDDKLFLTRYRYRGFPTAQRPFCKKMLAADMLYRKEDIVAAENKVVNSGWGPYGTDTYDVFKFKGGGNCHHFWQKEVYMSTLKSKVSLTSKQTRQIAVKKAESYGYKVRNEEEVAKLPVDMDWNGFLADNPVWGRNGTARKKKN